MNVITRTYTNVSAKIIEKWKKMGSVELRREQ